MGAFGLAASLFGGFVEPALRVRADRCLRASGSGCRECVDLCPAGALLLDARRTTAAPQPVPSSCTDCGLCAAACPSGAITGVGVPAGTLTRVAQRRVTAMSVACAPARRQRPRSTDPAFSVSCLAALHPETVVATALALAPGSTLVLVRAQCSECPTAQRARVEVVARESADLLGRLDDTGRRVELVDASSAVPDGELEPDVPPGGPAGRDWSRRELFAARRSAGLAGSAPAVTVARAELLSRSADASSAMGQLTHPLEALGCTFCDACVAVCPTRALSIDSSPARAGETDDGVPRLELVVDPSACVGCRRCAQVCVEGVLTLGYAAQPGSDSMAQPGAERRVVIAQGRWVTCESCDQPLSPGERGVCRRCESAAGLVADVLAR